MEAHHRTAHQDLWQRAIDSLDSETRAGLDPAKTGRREILNAVLNVAEEKRKILLKKRWKITKANGQTIVVRDVVEKIIGWARHFREVGDVAVQYDPQHASLPWAAVRFILQAAITEFDIHLEMVEGLEVVSRLLARYREIEKIHIDQSHQSSDLQTLLENALINSYSRILEYLSFSVSWYSTSTAHRLVKAMFSHNSDERRNRIVRTEQEVMQCANLIDSQRTLAAQEHTLRLLDLSASQQKAVDAQNFLEMLRWLSAVPYVQHHESQRQTRVNGTGEWLLQHPDYQSWFTESTSSLLLIHGIPGCGKTALASALIDHYLKLAHRHQGPVPVAYFYCSASEPEPDRRSAEGAFRSLVRQVMMTKDPDPMVHSALSALYEKQVGRSKANGFDTPRLSMSDCAELITEALESNPLYIVVDALDEIGEPVPFLDEIQKILQNARNIMKVVVISRDNGRIHSHLHAAQKIRVTDTATSQDIHNYAVQALDNAIVERRLLLGIISEELKQQVVETLVKCAAEMFLWIKLQVQRLCRCRHEEDVRNHMAAIESSTLQELYGTSLDMIAMSGDVSAGIAQRTLSWLLFSCEPLSPDALLSAIATNATWKQPTIDTVIDICQNLIYLDVKLGVMRLAHLSVREYLEQQPFFAASKGHELLTLSCLDILSQGPEEQHQDFKPTERTYDYATLYWGWHASVCDMSSHQSQLVSRLNAFMQIEDGPSLSMAMWVDTIKSRFPSLNGDHPQMVAMDANRIIECEPLFAASVYNLTFQLDCLAGVDWDQRNDNGYTALYFASHFGHLEVVRTLVEKGASLDIICGKFGTALHCAAFWGHTAIVKLLVERGVSPRLGGHFETAFHAACSGHRQQTAMFLAESTVDVNDLPAYDSALNAAAEVGFLETLVILKRRLQSGQHDNVNTGQLVHKTISLGSVPGLRFLTRSETLSQILPSNVVALSAQHGHEAMTAFLIDNGFSMDEPGDIGTPLRTASALGHQSTCRVLIDKGVDVNENGIFGPALHAAAMNGHAHTVKLLVDSGANVNLRGGKHGTALQAASYHGHVGIVQFLLDKDGPPNASGLYDDVFRAAEKGSQWHIIAYLQDRGLSRILSRPEVMLDKSMASARIHGRFKSLIGQARSISDVQVFRNMERGLMQDKPTLAFKTILRRGLHCFPLMQLLDAHLSKDALDSVDWGSLLSTSLSHFEVGRTPPDTVTMQELFKSGPAAAVQDLLSRLPTVKADGPEFGVLLQYAVVAGNLSFIKMLMEHSVNVNFQGSFHNTALQAACVTGHFEIADMLLNAGADPNLEGGDHGSALIAAVAAARRDMVELLLDNGVRIVNASNQSGRRVSPIESAIQSENSAIACRLIASGADANETCEHGQPLLVEACKAGDWPTVVALLEAGANVNTLHENRNQPDRCSALHAAILVGRADIAELLLQSGFDLTRDFGNDRAPLALATQMGDVATIDLVLNWYPNLPQSLLNQAAANAAASNSSHEVFLKLVSLGAAVYDSAAGHNVLVDYFRSWRDHSVRARSPIAEIILEHLTRTGDVDSACNEVLTTCYIRHPDVHVTLAEYMGYTPALLVECCIRGFKDVAQQCLENGINPHAEDDLGRPAFHFAVACGWYAIVELLLSYGANPDHRHDVYGHALTFALENCAAMKLLTSVELPEMDRQYLRKIASQTHWRDDIHIGESLNEDWSAFFKHRTARAIGSLLDHGPKLVLQRSRFGTVLQLASFIGLVDTFDRLRDCGAGDDLPDTWFASCMDAAMKGKESEMIRHLVGLGYLHVGSTTGGNGIPQLFEARDWNNIRLFLQNGCDPNDADENGETVLGICLRLQSQSWSYNPDLNTVIEWLAQVTTATSANDLLLATKTSYLSKRRPGSDRCVVTTMLEQNPQLMFNEETIVTLFQKRERPYMHPVGPPDPNDELIQYVLSHRRLDRLTNNIIGAARSANLVDDLLEYDRDFQVDAETLKVVCRKWRLYDNPRRYAATLLEREPLLVPTASNIIAACRNPSNEDSNLIDIMLGRNPDLVVTDAMLQAVSTLSDLKALVSHAQEGSKVVTADVMIKILENQPRYPSIELDWLQKLFSIVPSIELTQQLAEKILQDCKDTVHVLPVLWGRNPDIEFSAKAFRSTIHRLPGHNVDQHWRLIDLLHSYGKELRLTAEVKQTLDSWFSHDLQYHLKRMYYCNGIEEDSE